MSSTIAFHARTVSTRVRCAHGDSSRKVAAQKRPRKASGPVALPSATRRAGVNTLGCSPLFFESWTEFLMDNSDDRFTWDNRTGLWNFDHTVPQHAAKHGREDWELVHHWSNLRPMNARLNSSKGHHRDPEDEAEHLRLVQKFLVERTFGVIE
jgi:hypothetical protein